MFKIQKTEQRRKQCFVFKSLAMYLGFIIECGRRDLVTVTCERNKKGNDRSDTEPAVTGTRPYYTYTSISNDIRLRT